jgi:SAM-dependent methyltransferase
VQLTEVVPWGRSFDEYRRMFALSEADLKKRILGCADGPASFNAELTERGGKVVSVDPLYRFSQDQITARIAVTRDLVLAQVRMTGDQFVWEQIISVEQLAKLRATAMEFFLQDFAAGLQAGRYQAAELPILPFADQSFELALCSHFLFLYSDQLSLEFHGQALRELCRVAAEVRVFPLVRLDGQASEYVTPVVEKFLAEGYAADILQVDYEFQKGANKQLRIRRPCVKLSTAE